MQNIVTCSRRPGGWYEYFPPEGSATYTRFGLIEIDPFPLPKGWEEKKLKDAFPNITDEGIDFVMASSKVANDKGYIEGLILRMGSAQVLETAPVPHNQVLPSIKSVFEEVHSLDDPVEILPASIAGAQLRELATAR